MLGVIFCQDVESQMKTSIIQFNRRKPVSGIAAVVVAVVVAVVAVVAAAATL